eukprot:1160761-Pelagomonas_calceolata.AAC.10
MKRASQNSRNHGVDMTHPCQDIRQCIAPHSCPCTRELGAAHPSRATHQGIHGNAPMARHRRVQEGSRFAGAACTAEDKDAQHCTAALRRIQARTSHT